MMEYRHAILQHGPKASRIKSNDIIKRNPCARQKNEKIHVLISLSYDFMNMIVPLESTSNGNP